MLDDLISRQTAIDALMEFDKKLRKINWYQYPYIEHECRGVDKAIVKIANLPSAQPERLTDDDFETIRIHLNAHKEKLCNQHRWEEADEYQRIIDRFMAFASAQPDLDEVYAHAETEAEARFHAERKKGKWIKHIDDLFPAESTIECSECHHEQPLTIDSNFCPNCGARMEGE